MTLKQHVHELLAVSTSPEDNPHSRTVDLAILSLIFLNILALVLETVEPIYSRNPAAFEIFEKISLIIFSIEYLLRVWSCTTLTTYNHPLGGRILFMLTPLAIIDLLAILPLYLPLLGLDMRFIRVIRLLRFFRLAKLFRYSNALRLLGRVVLGKRSELTSILFVLLTLLLISSSLMYFAEHDDQPDKFSSIPETMWWGVITLTTVGYGDYYPVTGMGKFIAAVIAILGIGMFALPAGILGAGFVDELQDKNKATHHCPHCGKDFEEPA